MTIQLKINKNGNSRVLKLSENEIRHLQFEADVKYQLLDMNNQPIEGVWVQENGRSVSFFLPEQTQPILILNESAGFQAAVHLPQTVEIASTAVKAAEVASALTWGNVGWGVAALAGVGVAAAAVSSSNKKDKSQENQTENRVDEPKQQPENNAASKKAEQEKAEAERIAKEKAAQEKAEADRIAKEKAAQEKAEAERLAQEKAAQEKAEAERIAQEKAAQEKAEAERIAKEKAAQEKAEAERIAQEKAAQEKAEAERIAQEKAAQEKAEAERIAKEKAAQEKAEAERIAKEKAAQEKAEAERIAKEKAAQEKAEAERLAKEKAEQEAKERAEAEELAKNPPEIQFNNITDDNIINRDEAQAPAIALSGSLKNVRAGDVLTVKIGKATQIVEIKDNQFALNLDGKTLAIHQAISAELTRNNVKIAETTHNYRVDTQIDTPDITFRPIAGDNVINLNESKGKITVSGTVANAKDGDEILLSCGCPSCTGVEWVDIKTTIQNGGFSVDFNGADMVGNGRNIIKASVTTSDDAKNTATGTAQKSYDVDITPPEPSFVYEKIGENGVINRKIAENNIILRGKVINLGENETVAVKVVVNGQDFVATKNGDYYQVAIASGEFAGGQDVRWHLTAKDKAGNEKIIEQNQSYTYDVTLNNPTVEIATNNQIINNQSKGLTLSGSLNFDADVVQSSVKVAILLNNQTYSANVNTDNKTWTFSLPENIAKAVQGDNAFTVKISVADNAGNVAQNQSVGKFIVDTVAPQVQIALNPIGEIAQTGAEKVALSGTVSGEFKPTDKVKLLLNGTEFVANIAQNGTFSVEVPRTALLQNASKTLSASLETSDTAGNIGMATIEQNYTVGTVVTPPNTPKPISIQLDSLTSDDLINVTESKQATSKISGTVANADGQTVAIKIGAQTHSAQVQNGKFSLNINTQELIQNASGKIVATVGGQTIERAYAVDDFATSQLQITEIGEHFQVFAPNGTVQFTGKVDLSGGILGKWNNASFINSIQAALNGKTYLVGLNADKTFTLNIPLDEVKQAAGQSFTFSLPENRFSVYDLKSGRYSDSPMDYTAEYARLDDQSKYQLNDNPLFNNGKIVAPPTDLTAISGVVRGKATVGDTVVVQVGEHRHETQVEQGDKGLIFRVNVPTEQLLGVANETLSATLFGRDWQNKDYEISVLAKYEIGNADDKFVVTHPLASTADIATDPKAPYFVQAMAFSVTQGHLLKHPIGQNETAHLTYQFRPSSGSETTFNESNREATRNGLKMLEKYANIKFKEVGENEKADIGYIMTDGGSANGFADYGGSVWLNGRLYQQNDYAGLTTRKGYMTMIHETLHSLGAKHPFEGRAKFPSEENDKMVSFMNYVNKFNDAKLELPMYDLLYLHYRYGVNKTARTENNTYKFNAVNPNAVDGDVYVWDGGGVDTFDASDQKQGVTVDLTPGSWVHSGAKSQNFLVESVKNWNAQTFFNNQSAGRNLSEIYLDDKTPTYTTGQAFIGYGTQIERLIGSDFSDSLKGNIANNDIYGNDGNDTIFGDAGNDYLDGGKGADALSGGLGNDIFVVDDVGDQVLENADEGVDTVYAHIDYTLGDNVENLTLFGTATKGVGNALDNRMVGNGQANTLTGGGGKDTFVFNDVLDGNVDTITDFTVGVDKIELNPFAFVGLTAENLAERIAYDSKTGHLTYDPDGFLQADGSGKADVIHFATLANKPNLTVDGNHFVLSSAENGFVPPSKPTTPNNPPSNPAPAEIAFNAITDDNIINRDEAQAPTITLSGSLKNALAGDVLTVKIGSVEKVFEIQGNDFTFNLDGKTLAVHQAISAELTRNGTKIAETTHAYRVDTDIATPEITFRPIAGDNIINLVESRNKINVSGTVKGANEGDEITISCGCPTCTGVEWVDIKTTVQNGGFSVDFNGSDMVANGRTVVKASVTTADDAKNTATGTAQKSYDVDIAPPEPSFVYNDIGNKGVINREIAKNSIVLTGKIANLGENETVAVKVVVNGKDYTATKNGDVYQATVASGEFASGQAVKWHLTARDKAGNEKIIEQNQSYIYDVALSEPTVEIATNNQVINSQSKGLTLSGSLNFDDDVNKSSVKVEILLNNQTYSANVNAESKTWTVSLPENIAKQHQGDNAFTVKISVADTAGNVAQNQSVGKFMVDTVAPQIGVTLNNIGEITQTGTEKVTLSGAVSGEFKPSDKVKVSVNGTEFVANIAQNATFSVEVPRTALIQNASKKILASLETTDTAGNVGMASSEQNYSVPSTATSPNTQSIQLDKVTSDDVINVTESKIATTKITGTASGADGQTVTLRFGDKTVTATVQNGKFSVDINTQDLVENQSGKMIATLGGKTIERAYSVDNFASAQIKISEMAEIAPSEMVRLTGKVKLEGLFAQYQNPIQLQSFVATLNGKEYAVAVNTQDQTFAWNISLADLQAAKGQEIGFVNKGGLSLYYVENGYARYKPIPNLDKSAYEFDDNPYVANGAVKSTLPTAETLIKGTVSGSAKVGDAVEILIGTETVRTEVQNDLSFAVSVANGVLKQADKVTATLTGQNHQGQAISVHTEHAYKTDSGSLKGDFVTKFVAQSESELPYIIKGLESYHKQDGYLKRFAYGQGAEITYSFNKEYLNARDWTMGNRQAVRDALKNYAKYADLKFVELEDNSGVYTTDGKGRADIEFHHRPLRGGVAGNAEFGGNVNISTNHNSMESRTGFHTVVHEIGHSLGMKHTHETPNQMNYAEDHTGLSVMSYQGTNMNVNRWDLRMYDIAFVQYRYGVNKTQRAGNDTYTFKAFNPQSPDGDIYIWDGAGVDTFDASKENDRVTVDLTPGSWIHRGEKAEHLAIKSFVDLYTSTFFTGHEGYVNDDLILINGKLSKFEYTEGQAFIGYGTQIERLIGSAHSDSLKGNIADNEIFGGAGDDVIHGRAGHDHLDGGKGTDEMHGNAGNDIFVVDNAGDKVVELADEGTDTVYAHVNYKLSDFVENLALFGNAVSGEGNALDNRIVGNAQANTLTGGAGRDTFVFSSVLDGTVDTITDFALSQDKIELALSKFAGLTKENLAERVKYDVKTGALSYDADGAGEADAVQFATLQNKPNLTIDETHFILA